MLSKLGSVLSKFSAISLTYDNKLIKAVTRGDGITGENVTHNILTMKGIPQSINQELEVRGEIYISKSEFLRINETETKTFANPRNLAAGTIRQKDEELTKQRKLELIAYGLVEPEKYGIDNYYDSMNYIKELGFPINEYIKK